MSNRVSRFQFFLIFFLLGLLVSCSLDIEAELPTRQTVIQKEAQVESLLPFSTSALAQVDRPGETPSPPRPVSAQIKQSGMPTPMMCRKNPGQMELHSLQTDKLPLPLEFRVWLPPCYDELAADRFPVLYLIHGQSFTDDQWDRLGADEMAASMIASGEAPPFIIVMPRDRSWAQPTEDRFGEVVIEELIPWIDTQYRSLPDREYRSVGGLSRGGGWAVHFALSHPDLFSSLGAHSVAIFWADTPKIKKWLGEIPEELPLRIYLDIGDHDRMEIRRSAMWFENLLTGRGISHEWHLFSGFHDEEYWGNHVDEYLRWFVEGWDLPSLSVDGSIELSNSARHGED